MQVEFCNGDLDAKCSSGLTILDCVSTRPVVSQPCQPISGRLLCSYTFKKFLHPLNVAKPPQYSFSPIPSLTLQSIYT